MEIKTGIEEKRVKSTIIRRRAKAEPTPEPQESFASLPTREDKTSEQIVKVKVDESQKSSELAASPPIAPTSSDAIIISRPPPVSPASVGTTTREDVLTEAAKDKAKKATRRKTRDELEMEMIERAGGLKKVAEIIETAPERLERVFRPDRSSKKKRVLTHKEFKKTEITTPKATKRVLRIEGSVTVSDLSHRMGIKAPDVIRKLMNLGMMATINQTIDTDTAILVAHDFGYEVENVEVTEESILGKIEGKLAAAKEGGTEGGAKEPRPPIVTVMGHVDHGKTSLLDFIRKAQVAAGEAGGITQHIGAYEVKHPKGSITFVDTPGHEAFTAMRARGAQVTDIVILVVAADDGIMPQTIEAIHHARAAKVPIIVAINKVDKPDANIPRVERGLMEQGLISEKLGGDIIIVPVSAKTGQGINDLLDMVLLQSEVLELKSNPTRKAVGTIIEAKLDKGRGPVATVIVQDGTLHKGDLVVAGTVYGKVRALIDALGQMVTEAPPSKPVEVLGLSGVPLAGDKLYASDSEDDVRDIVEHRGSKLRATRQQAPSAAARLEDLFAKASQGEVPEVRFIIKGDVQGSVEALKEAVGKMSLEKVRVSVLHVGVGAITESDVMLAVASRAIIIGFNMRPDSKARALAEHEKVQIRTYSIIYEVIDDVRKAMEGALAPTYEEKYLGRAEIRQLFTVSKIGTIAGCSVVDGKIVRSATVRVLRDGKVICEGKISSLKRFKDDAREVTTGLECGIGVENFNDLKLGDLIEAFVVEQIAGKL